MYKIHFSEIKKKLSNYLDNFPNANYTIILKRQAVTLSVWNEMNDWIRFKSTLLIHISTSVEEADISHTEWETIVNEIPVCKTIIQQNVLNFVI